MVEGSIRQQYFIPVSIAAFLMRRPSSATNQYLRENGIGEITGDNQLFLETRVDRDQWCAIVEYATQLPDYGQFLIGENYLEMFAQMALPFNLILCQETVGEAFTTIQRCFNYNSPLSMLMSQDAKSITLSFDARGFSDAVRSHNFLRMAAVRRLICGRASGDGVSFIIGTNLSKAVTDKYEFLDTNDLIFGDGEFVRLAKVDAMRRLSSNNADKRRALTELFATQTKLLRPMEVLTARVMSCLKRRLGTNTATLQNIASDMGMGTRTLQRRLTENGASFAFLLDKARYEEHAAMREETKYSLGQIAGRLGYLDTNSLYRARARWRLRPPQ